MPHSQRVAVNASTADTRNLRAVLVAIFIVSSSSACALDTFGISAGQATSVAEGSSSDSPEPTEGALTSMISEAMTGSEGSATGGAPIHCSTPEDCPADGGPCLERLCSAGKCAIELMEAGAMPVAQVLGDCRDLVCDDMGELMSTFNDADFPSDMNSCTMDLCDVGRPVHVPLGPSGPVTVFDGISNGISNGTFGFGGIVQFGQILSLDIGGDTVTEIQVAVRAQSMEPEDVEFRIRIYEAGDSGPGPLLWSSLAKSVVDLPVDATIFTFPVPDIVVPESIFIAIEEIEGPLGVNVFQPPAIGKAEDFYRLKVNGPPWLQSYAQPNESLGYKVTAYCP